MCVVSMIGDWFQQGWYEKHPDWKINDVNLWWPAITRAEFDALKKEVEDLKSLLKAAKIYDAKNNEPNCETDEKLKLLRGIAEKLGVKLD